MKTIPMEFSSLSIVVLPAFFGSPTILVMALLSYFSSITTEEERMFRFGLLTIGYNIMDTLGLLLATPAYNLFGYFCTYRIIMLFL